MSPERLFDLIEQRFGEMRETLGSIEQRLDAVDTRLTVLETQRAASDRALKILAWFATFALGFAGVVAACK